MTANVNIVVNAQDRASGVFRKVGHALSGILKVALGIRLSQTLQRMGDAVRQFAINSIDAASGLQMFKIGIETLIAREQLMADRTMDIGDAFAFAAAMSGDYITRLQSIALISPFQFTDVQRVVRQAMAFGFGAEEALEYARATLNVAAGVGATNDMLRRMAYNLAQIRLQGKVTKLDIRQLALAGFDLGAVLRYVGTMMDVQIDTYSDFNKAIATGTITWADFTKGYAEYADTYFGGASERMTRTFFGLKNTMKDVFAVTMPQILGPTLDVITSYTSHLLDLLIDLRESGQLEIWGQELKTSFDTQIKPVLDFLFYGKTDANNPVARMLNMFRHLKEEGFFGKTWEYIFEQMTGINLTPLQKAVAAALSIITTIRDDGILADSTLGLLDMLFKLDEGTLSGIRDTIIGIVENIRTVFTEGLSTKGGVDALAALLGIDPEIITGIIETIGKVIDWFVEQGEKLAPFFEMMGEQLDESGPVLKGIGMLAAMVASDSFLFFVDTLERMVGWLESNAEALGEWSATSRQALGVIGFLFKAAWTIIMPILGLLRDTVLDLGSIFLNLFTGNYGAALEDLGRILMRLIVYAGSFVVEMLAVLLDSLLFLILGDNWTGWTDFFAMIANVLGLLKIIIWDGLILGTIASIAAWWLEVKTGFEAWWGPIREQGDLLLTEWIAGLQDKWATFRDETFPGWMADIKEWFTGNWLSEWLSMGESAMDGFVQGFVDRVTQAKKDLAAGFATIVKWLRDILQMESPSRVFYEMGRLSMEGYLQGLQPAGMLSMGLNAIPHQTMAGAGARGGGTTVIHNYNGLTLQNRLQAETALRPIIRKIKGR